MLVKYNGNADKTEGTAAITGLESGYDIPIGGVGELTDQEYATLSTRLQLEVVGDGWDSFSKDELEEHAPKVGVSLDGLSTKDDYVKAMASRRTAADAAAEATDDDSSPDEGTGLPATATGSGPAAPVGGGGGAAGPAGSPPPGNAGAGGGRS